MLESFKSVIGRISHPQRFPQTSQATRSLLSCLFVRLEPIELFVWQGLGGRLDNLLSL
jgi:hypothetical protein